MIIDAVLTPPEIDLLPQRNLSASACIVFDVLRATSSIITGLAHGVEEIRPVCTIEEAVAARGEWPGAILGGERHGDRIEGFDLGNSPLEYCEAGPKKIVTTTTNGTVALRACEAAAVVITGALLNMDALIDRLKQLRKSGIREMVLVCAGTGRELAMEDVIAAGMLAAAFPEAEKTDAAHVAIEVYSRHITNLLAGLQHSKNGRVLVNSGRGADVAWCSQVSLYPIVGVMRDGVIRKG